MRDAAMPDCGWALRYARCLYARRVPSRASLALLKAGFIVQAMTLIEVFGYPAGLVEVQSASPATAPAALTS